MANQKRNNNDVREKQDGIKHNQDDQNDNEDQSRFDYEDDIEKPVQDDDESFS